MDTDTGETAPANVNHGGGIVLVTYMHKSGTILAKHSLLPLLDHLALAETTETVSGDSLSGVARWKGLADDTDTDTDTNTRIATMECVSRSSLVAQGLAHYGRRLLNPKRTTVVSVPRALFACADTRAAFGDKQRPRVAQLYRDPFDMVVSGYLYHLEGNEAWINTYTPKAGSVSSSAMTYMAAQLHIPLADVMKAVNMHHDLFHKSNAVKYFAALKALPTGEGLRMEAARYFLFPRNQRDAPPGSGDMLRMTANVDVVKRQFVSELFLMEDWISSNATVVAETLTRFVSLVCGDGAGGEVACDAATRAAAPVVFLETQRRTMHPDAGKTAHDHVTHTSTSEEARAAMKAQLRADPVLGPLLSYCRCVVRHKGVDVYGVCCFGMPDGRCQTAE